METGIVRYSSKDGRVFEFSIGKYFNNAINKTDLTLSFSQKALLQLKVLLEKSNKLKTVKFINEVIQKYDDCNTNNSKYESLAVINIKDSKRSFPYEEDIPFMISVLDRAHIYSEVVDSKTIIVNAKDAKRVESVFNNIFSETTIVTVDEVSILPEVIGYEKEFTYIRDYQPHSFQRATLILGLALRFQNEIEFAKDADVMSVVGKFQECLEMRQAFLTSLDVHSLNITKKIKYFDKKSKCLVEEDFQLCSVYLDECEKIHLGFEVNYGDYPSEEIVFRAN